MLIEVQNTHRSNTRKRIVVCNYGYFRPNPQWEAIVINLRPIKKTVWIWRKKEYKDGWPVSCG